MNNQLRKKHPRIKFNEQTEFNSFLENMRLEDKWLIEKTDCLRIGYISPGSTVEYKYEAATNDQIEEAYACGSLFIEMMELGKFFLLNDGALFTLKDRAGITCKHTTQLLNMGKYEDFCRFVNFALPEYKGKKSLILVRSGQVLAAHSSNYVTLNQVEIYDELIKNIQTRFPNAEFDNSVYTHNLTSCSYCLSNYKDKIMDIYRQAWIDSGLNQRALEQSFPVLTVNTSDTGEFCLEVEPILKLGSYYYPLGDKIRIKHHGTASISKLNDALRKSFAKLQEGLGNVADLITLKIEYPIPAMVRAAEETGIAKNAKKACKKIVEAYKSCLLPGQSIMAFDIYMQLCEIRYTLEFQKMKPATRLKVTENLYRLLTLDWSDLDEPGKVEVA